MIRHKPSILFVDDEQKVLKSLMRVLRDRRDAWEMVFENSPVSAIERMRETAADVVVSDLTMPELTGLEMIRQMRGQARPGTAFILLTGNGDLASAIEAINAAGVFRFLTKPCATPDLIEAIEAALVRDPAPVEAETPEVETLARAALAGLSPAIAVLDAAGRIAYLNDSAAEMAARRDGFSIDAAGRCRASNGEAGKLLLEAIAAAAGSPDEPPRYLALPRSSDGRDLKAVITAIGPGRAALMVTEPDRVAVPTAESLADLLGLSRAEAIIAHTIAGGGNLDAAAALCGITIESARTYLKRIFQKTGVGRQSDLVQLVLSTPAPLVRRSDSGPSTPRIRSA